MNEERINEVFSDEAFLEELISTHEPEKIQALLEDKDIEVSIAEIEKFKEMVMKKLENPDADLEAELNDDDLEDVSGGSLLAGVFVLVYVVTPIVGFITAHINKKTNGRW